MSIRLTIIYLFISGVVFGQLSDLDRVRQRVIEDLLTGQVDTAEISSISNSLSPDGTWPDLNYQDTSRTGFQHGTHLNRMNILARSYRNPGSPFYDDPLIGRAIDLAFKHWLTQDYICANWWWNQIGTPWRMADFMLMMDGKISPAQRELATPIIGRANLGAWGARPGGDLIKIAGIMGRQALFDRDTLQLQTAVTTMSGEIQYAGDRGTPNDLRGLQADLGFHHRDDRVTSILSYGKGFAAAFAEWAAFLGGTKYAFPEAKIHLLVDYYIDGISAAMAFGAYPDPGAMNRGLSRPGTLARERATIPKNLLLATDYRVGEMTRVVDARSDRPISTKPSNTFFYSSEYMSQQRPGYFTSARMYSNRNHSVEVPYNGEGIKNHYLADGANWLTVTGKEYLDIFPVFDYRKVPGTTVVQKPGLPDAELVQQAGLTNFVGGVSDGKYGAAAFDLVSPLDSLAARKSWFFFDEEYVCLGAGINSNDAYPVATTIDQRWREGEIVSEPDHVWHAGTGYYFARPTSLAMETDTAAGRWSDINIQADSPTQLITGEVFKLWIDHGEKPSGGEYAYIVLPAVSKDSVATYGQRSAIDILANTPDRQAVAHRGLGIYQVVFYTPGSITLMEGITLSLSTAGLVMVRFQKGELPTITLADPTHQLKETTLGLSTLDTLITVELPRGENAGRSVRVAF